MFCIFFAFVTGLLEPVQGVVAPDGREILDISQLSVMADSPSSGMRMKAAIYVATLNSWAEEGEEFILPEPGTPHQRLVLIRQLLSDPSPEVRCWATYAASAEAARLYELADATALLTELERLSAQKRMLDPVDVVRDGLRKPEPERVSASALIALSDYQYLRLSTGAYAEWEKRHMRSAVNLWMKQKDDIDTVSATDLVCAMSSESSVEFQVTFIRQILTEYMSHQSRRLAMDISDFFKNAADDASEGKSYSLFLRLVPLIPLLQQIAKNPNLPAPEREAALTSSENMVGVVEDLEWKIGVKIEPLWTK